MTRLNQINPWYVSGLTQADGTFFCVVSHKANVLFGLQFRPKFAITQDLGSIDVLVKVQDYFGCGIIHTNLKNHSAELVVDNKLDLMNVIIPHFIKYSVVLDKLHSFNLFRQILVALVNRTHRTAEERAKLLNMALSMNPVSQRTPENINALYTKLGWDNGSSIPLIPNTDTVINGHINSNFIAGFIDGDGSFHILFNKDGSIKPGITLVGSVSILPLLEYVKTVLSNVGSINITKNGTVARWIVSGINQITETVIPFMDNEILHTEKSRHYSIFRESCSILASSNITLSDRLRVVELAYNMNKGGKNRKMTKQQYINNLTSSQSPYRGINYSWFMV